MLPPETKWVPETLYALVDVESYREKKDAFYETGTD
jgi:hypothetical protein